MPFELLRVVLVLYSGFWRSNGPKFSNPKPLQQCTSPTDSKPNYALNAYKGRGDREFCQPYLMVVSQWQNVVAADASSHHHPMSYFSHSHGPDDCSLRPCKIKRLSYISGPCCFVLSTVESKHCTICRHNRKCASTDTRNAHQLHTVPITLVRVCLRIQAVGRALYYLDEATSAQSTQLPRQCTKLRAF